MITAQQNPIEPNVKSCQYHGRVANSIAYCRHEKQAGDKQSVAVPLAVCRECPLFQLRDGVEVQPIMRPDRSAVRNCTHRGDVARQVQCKTCSGVKLIDVHSCDIHGECANTRGEWDRIRKSENGTKVKNCERCQDAECGDLPMIETLEIVHPVRNQRTIPFLTTEDLTRDTLRLLPQLSPDVTEIVGVARSGMAPASILAMHLHLPLLSLDQNRQEIVSTGKGWRLGSPSSRDGISLIVDDTIMSGTSLAKTRKVIGDDPRYKIAVVYANPAQLDKIDYHAVALPGPHILEWNLFNSVFVPSSMYDMDGILCHDCPALYDDDAEHYEAFLRDVKPLYLVRKSPINIVTARLEKYREPTLAWLDKWGVKVNTLTMGPWGSYQERLTADVGAWKGEVFREFFSRDFTGVGPRMFIESDSRQAQRIYDVSGGVVVCPSARKVWV